MVNWLKNFFKSEKILSNGCIVGGHKFSDYNMCLICGGYRNDKS